MSGEEAVVKKNPSRFFVGGGIPHVSFFTLVQASNIRSIFRSRKSSSPLFARWKRARKFSKGGKTFSRPRKFVEGPIAHAGGRAFAEENSFLTSGIPYVDRILSNLCNFYSCSWCGRVLFFDTLYLSAWKFAWTVVKLLRGSLYLLNSGSEVITYGNK